MPTSPVSGDNTTPSPYLTCTVPTYHGPSVSVVCCHFQIYIPILCRCGGPQDTVSRAIWPCVCYVHVFDYMCVVCHVCVTTLDVKDNIIDTPLDRIQCCVDIHGRCLVRTMDQVYDQWVHSHTTKIYFEDALCL